jgi:hypothetical protein
MLFEAEVTQLVLPQELYYDYVRPFTPFKDRAILDKRTGSTQFYAGERVDIDSAFLQNYFGRTILSHTDLPTLDLGFSLVEMEDPWVRDDVSEKNLLHYFRNVRRAWDAHMSTIKCPSARLNACLHVLINYCSRNSPDGNENQLPLLFPGTGTVEDVVRFHVSMNPRSINGIPAELIGSIPHTLTTNFTDLNIGLLGQWVFLYLTIGVSFCLLGEGEGGNPFSDGKITDRVEWILGAMFDCVDDVDIAPLFEPLDSLKSNLFYSRFFEPGNSTVDCLRSYAEWSLEEHNGQGMDRLGWLLRRLETKFNVIRPTLRFAVGERVECHMSPDPEDWEMATVVMQWHTRHPYLTRLDSGINVSAAHDTDDFIRTPLTPAERQRQRQDFHNAEDDNDEIEEVDDDEEVASDNDGGEDDQQPTRWETYLRYCEDFSNASISSAAAPAGGTTEEEVTLVNDTDNDS